MQEPDIHGAFARHEHIAFEFSGGADSLAALYVMRPFWDRMTVYHGDAGDQFPEVKAIVERVSHDLPITLVYGDVQTYRQEVGMPSDVVPFDNTAVGRALSGRIIKIVSKMECCAANLMDPLHRHVVAAGNTLIVRGTRREEFKGEGYLSSGWTDGQVELLNPIEHWKQREVLRFLHDNDLPVPPFYEHGMRQAPECMGCTAWWGEGRMAYLRQFHPAEAVIYEKNLRTIRAEVIRAMAESLQELRNVS